MTNVPYVCPRCRGPLDASVDLYGCGQCDTTYPIIAGIPDFRVTADPWLDFEGDRDKAIRLHSVTANLSFEESVRAYWDMTPSTPRWLADRFVGHVTRAQQRSAEWLDTLDVRGDISDRLTLDLGCGTGDLLAACAVRAERAIGIDIALRWLVVARRRPELQNDNNALVCCNAEHLPFPQNTFSRVTALGLLEHCTHPEPVCREAFRVLRPDGRMHVRTVNRYSLLPEPHVQLWGVGFLPRRLAPAYVELRTGGPYEHHRTLSARELRHAFCGAGFRNVSARAAIVLPAEGSQMGTVGQSMIPVYAALRRFPIVRAVVAWIAPLVECSGEVA